VSEQPVTVPVYLGWQYSPGTHWPGPAPARPALPRPVAFDPGWVSAQRRIAHQLARPARYAGVACAVATVLVLAAWAAGLASTALAGCITCVAVGGLSRSVRSQVRGGRQVGAVITAERLRAGAARESQSRVLAAAAREHAKDYRAWQRRTAVFERRPSWFAVPLPDGIDRLDIAGGTLAGWSALLTMIAAPHLTSGGEMTVLDLTEGVLAGDLVNLARQSGLEPLVWVLPADLPRLDLGTGLSAEALADVLSVAAGTSAEAGAHGAGAPDPAADCALLERVLGALGPEPRIAQVTAALRVLADVGDPRADLRSGLISAGQLERLGMLFGRGAAERVVIERAWMLESRLRRLDPLGGALAELPRSRLRVLALDRRSGVVGNRILGSYLVAALTHVLRQSPPGRPWAHTLCLFGAERLGGEVIDRLTQACEACGTGLVLAFRAIPAPVRERLGRGNAAVAFMRLGNGEEARAASELIGTEHRFVVGQLTDTIGSSVTDTWGDSYTSTVGTANSVSDSFAVSTSRGGSSGRGRSRSGSFTPFAPATTSRSGDASYSRAESDTASLTEGINSGTSWGISLSRAIGENFSAGRTAQRSRELLVEPDELQRLPPTAAIVTYPAPAARMVLLADVNPALVTLPGAVLRGLAADESDSG